MRGPISCLTHEVTHLWDDQAKMAVCGSPAIGCEWNDLIAWPPQEDLLLCTICHEDEESPMTEKP